MILKGFMSRILDLILLNARSFLVPFAHNWPIAIQIIYIYMSYYYKPHPFVCAIEAYFIISYWILAKDIPLRNC